MFAKEMRIMPNESYAEQDRVFSLDEFKQFDRLNKNTNSRIPIFFCIDVSGSMRNKVEGADSGVELTPDDCNFLGGDKSLEDFLNGSPKMEQSM